VRRGALEEHTQTQIYIYRERERGRQTDMKRKRERERESEIERDRERRFLAAFPFTPPANPLYLFPAVHRGSSHMQDEVQGG